MKSLLFAAAAFALCAAAASAQGQGCTRETLHVRGTPVTVGYCVLGGRTQNDGTVQVSETYSSPRGSFSQTSSLGFIGGDQPSRIIEDVALEQLGLHGTLHLTLVRRDGKVLVEAAILTPGAITIK